MSFSATVYRVLIASPNDLQEERRIIERVIHAWNASFAEDEGVVLLPVRFETHSVPEFGDRPQSLMNRRIADCDILVGAFWTRLGTPTGMYESGTVEEIDEFRRARKPILLYFSERPVRLKEVDPEQIQRVRAFRARLQQLAVVHEFSSPGHLKHKLLLHLHEHVRRLKRSGSTSPLTEATEPNPVPHPPGAVHAPAAPLVERGESSDSGEPASLYTDYWTGFRDALLRSGSRLRPPTIREKNYIRFPMGSSNIRIHLFASVRERQVGIELVLDRPECTRLIEELRVRRSWIDRALGSDVQWREHQGSYRIVQHRGGFDPADRTIWPQQHAWLGERLALYYATFSTAIREITAELANSADAKRK